MAKLGTCSGCGGFVAEKSAACPHCGKRGRALLGLAGGVLGGGALAFTLMACYGMAPCPDGQRDCHGMPPAPNADDAGSMPKAADPPPSTPVAAPDKK